MTRDELFVRIAIAAGIFGFLVMIWTSSFGARCSRAYPNDGLAQERCIYRLSKGMEP